MPQSGKPLRSHAERGNEPYISRLSDSKLSTKLPKTTRKRSRTCHYRDGEWWQKTQLLAGGGQGIAGGWRFCF